MPLLHSKILGEGLPFLILHGFLGMLDNWKTLGAKYAMAGWQVHLIDQRNHGKSFQSEVFNYEVMAEDLREYMAHYKLSSAVVLGHSMGGKTAMEFACKYPDVTEKLIVVDIAPKFYPPHHQAIINALNTLNFDKIQSRSDAEQMLAKQIKEVAIRQFLLKNLYWRDATHLGFRFNLNILSHKMEEVGENIGSTAHYPGPTLFIRGDRSEYISEADMPEIKRHFPKAVLDTVDQAGHWVHAENPKQFYEKTMAFLNS